MILNHFYTKILFGMASFCVISACKRQILRKSSALLYILFLLTCDGNEAGFPLKKHFQQYRLNSYYGHKLPNGRGIQK